MPFYLHYIAGYHGDDVYRQRALQLNDWGFERLRSEPDAEGKVIEVWYLGEKGSFKGELAGKSHAEAELIILRKGGAGWIDIAKRYGLLLG